MEVFLIKFDFFGGWPFLQSFAFLGLWLFYTEKGKRKMITTRLTVLRTQHLLG